MPSANLCTEDGTAQSAYGFYDRVRKEEVMEPAYHRPVKDWDTHLFIKSGTL